MIEVKVLGIPLRTIHLASNCPLTGARCNECNVVLQWANAMAAQGSGGAYEISQRMTAMIGWGGTADFKEDWAYDQACCFVHCILH
jgi:CobN/Magnesium Chelatase